MDEETTVYKWLNLLQLATPIAVKRSRKPFANFIRHKFNTLATAQILTALGTEGVTVNDEDVVLCKDLSLGLHRCILQRRPRASCPVPRGVCKHSAILHKRENWLPISDATAHIQTNGFAWKAQNSLAVIIFCRSFVCQAHGTGD